MNVRAFIVSHVILKRAKWPQRAFQGRIYDSDLVAHRFRSSVLWFRSTLSYGRRTLRHRPVLRTQRSLLFSHHRPKRTLGFVGLRIHRSGSLSLSLTRLDPKPPATRAFPPRQLDRPVKFLLRIQASDFYYARLSGISTQHKSNSPTRHPNSAPRTRIITEKPFNLAGLFLETTKSILWATTRMTLLTCFTALLTPQKLVYNRLDVRGRHSTRLVNDHGMVVRAGAREVDIPRLTNHDYADPTGLLYYIPPEGQENPSRGKA